MSVTVTSSKRLTQLRSEDAIVSGVVTAASFTGALTGNASTATMGKWIFWSYHSLR
jgi:hypothetical protein